MIRVRVANPYAFAADYARIKEAVRTVLEGEGRTDAAVTVALVNDPHIHQLNRQFLQHDEPTDVLTFPYSEPTSRRLEGEIVISVDTAQREAAARGHDPATELLLYVIHGCLHLCGEDDTTPTAAQQMRHKERIYLLRLGLPDIASAAETGSPTPPPDVQ